MIVSPLIWQYVVSAKSTVKISLIFVAFLENTNFFSSSKVEYFVHFSGEIADTKKTFQN